jgi:hypothetical protein
MDDRFERSEIEFDAIREQLRAKFERMDASFERMDAACERMDRICDEISENIAEALRRGSPTRAEASTGDVAETPVAATSAGAGFA